MVEVGQKFIWDSAHEVVVTKVTETSIWYKWDNKKGRDARMNYGSFLKRYIPA